MYLELKLVHGYGVELGAKVGGTDTWCGIEVGGYVVELVSREWIRS